MKQDFRFALRMISSHRWFSLAVIATLALGIGMNTMVFTIIDAVLFKPVPVPGGDRLVTIVDRDLNNTRRDHRRMPVSWPDFIDYRAHTHSLEALEAGTGDGATLSEQGKAPQHYNMFRVSSGLFGMLHIPPVRGRDFIPSDSNAGAAPVVLLGYAIWKERYGEGDVVGRVIRVNGVPATVVGVMPDGLRFPSEEDLWMPLQPDADLRDRTHRPLQLFGMMRPGVTLNEAMAEFDVSSRQLAREFPKEDKDLVALVQTFHQRYNGDQIQLVFSLMMAAVAFVLLIACANVANMMLGQALGRRREMSIRAAVGASRWQIVRQLLIESLLLSLIGGVAGLGLCAIGVHGFDLATQNVGKPYWVQFAMDYRVFGYFAVVCVLSAMVFGLVPALRSSRTDVSTALKESVRSTGTQRGGRLSGMLVVFQFALTLVLLLGAAVFMKTFVTKQAINPWIQGDRLMTARVNLPEAQYRNDPARIRFFDRLLSSASALPGIETVALTSDLPGTGCGTRSIEIEGAPAANPARRPVAAVIVVSPAYFGAINLPIQRGRNFNSADDASRPLQAVVTADFAGRQWGRGDALGKRFRFYDKGKPGAWITVAGVSGNIEQQPLEAVPDPLLFLPYTQQAADSMALLARTPNPASAVPALRAAVQALDQDLPLFEPRTMTETTEHQIWFLRLFGTIFLVFAAIALLMASVGIYAVMAQATGSRTREIGVRIALGATSRSILAMVLRRGLWQLIGGLALGVAAAIPASRAMGSLGFLDAPSDPSIVAPVGIVLSVVGLFACWLPARRAAALNPVRAIQNE